MFLLPKLGSSASTTRPAIVDNATVAVETVFAAVPFQGDSAVQVQTVSQDLQFTGSGKVQVTAFTNHVISYGVATDGSGNVYTVGTVEAIYGSGILAQVPFVSKTTSGGTVVWQHQLTPNTNVGGSFNDCVIDSSGNLYVVGQIDNFCITMMINSSGTIIWEQLLEGLVTMQGNGITHSSLDGNVAIVGTCGTVPTEIFVAMYNSSGALLWQNLFTYPNFSCYGNGICFDPSGAVFVVGSAVSTVTQTTGVNYTGSHPYVTLGLVMSFIGTGAMAAVAQFYLSTNLYSISTADDIVVDANYNVYVTGTFTQDGTYTAGYPIMIKVNNITLASEWQYTFQTGFTPSTYVLDGAAIGSVRWTSVALDASNNPYMLYSGTLYSVSPSGTWNWTEYTYQQNSSTDVTFDSSGNCFITGQFASPLVNMNIDFDGFNYLPTIIKFPVSQCPETFGAGGINMVSLNSGNAISGTNCVTIGSPEVSVASSSLAVVAGGYAFGTVPFVVTESFSTTAFTAPGGLIWIKDLTEGYNNYLFDTVTSNGSSYLNFDNSNPLTLYSSAGDDEDTIAFMPHGFFNPFDGVPELGGVAADSYAAWMFTRQAKFFDIVTYVGNGTQQTINHGLGVVPGLVLIKVLSVLSGYSPLGWLVAHIDGGYSSNEMPSWGTTANFTVGSNPICNAAGYTYVAYLFAHDPSPTGLIQCGYYTGNNSAQGNLVNLGWEPEFVMILSETTTNVLMFDENRGMTADGYGYASVANAPTPQASYCGFNQPKITKTPNGFFASANTAQSAAGVASDVNASGVPIRYVAIRRGPMAFPTKGTKVFNALLNLCNGTSGIVDGFGFSPDLIVSTCTTGNAHGAAFFDKLRGVDPSFCPPIVMPTTANEITYMAGNSIQSILSDGFKVGNDASYGLVNANVAGGTYSTFVYWGFRRAPGFFEQVCYTGNGAAQTLNHNLAVPPELMIICDRTSAANRVVWCTKLPSSYFTLNTGNPQTVDTGHVFFGNGASALPPNAENFSVGPSLSSANDHYVAYMFASTPGVSLIGTYVGNGGTQTINCNFTNGARFVMIKNTSATGDWYVWDVARGSLSQLSGGVPVSPHTSINSAAADVIADASVTFVSGGFAISQVSPVNINVTNDTYIFMAIA
jgi:hypothetical protein